MSTVRRTSLSFFFFFNDTATTEIYTLSLHDALPIYPALRHPVVVRKLPQDRWLRRPAQDPRREDPAGADRKSTRLNSSHSQISYAVFCLKKTRRLTFAGPGRDLECRATHREPAQATG